MKYNYKHSKSDVQIHDVSILVHHFCLANVCPGKQGVFNATESHKYLLTDVSALTAAACICAFQYTELDEAIFQRGTKKESQICLFVAYQHSQITKTTRRTTVKL